MAQVNERATPPSLKPQLPPISLRH